MKTIRKWDIVILPDGSCGEALEVFIADVSRVYKIKRLDNNEIQYFDESKVVLKKQHLRNLVASLFSREK